MFTFKRLSKVLDNAQEISFDDSSRIVLISDCHRGDNSWTDDFADNQNLLYTALKHYNDNKFTYIELGDGDELWKNRDFIDIRQTYSNIFKMLRYFYLEKRFYAIWGNHDKVKSDPEYVETYLYKYYDVREKEYKPLFEDIKLHEGLVLKHLETDDRILVTHGHQGDLINDQFWKLGRFLVRYLWKNLEFLGVKNPTSPAKNYTKADRLENKLINWSKEKKTMLIAGHTHRAMFPDIGGPLYFNDGSCVNPRCITGIEIDCGKICLIKWSIKTTDEGILYVGKDILAGPNILRDYF